jgi:hypothetical protein
MGGSESVREGGADPLGTTPSKRAAAAFAAALFLIALWLRLAGVSWGLPNEGRHQSLHPDEFLIAATTLASPYFKPNFYNYGTAYLTLLKIGSDAGMVYGWVPVGENVPEWQTLRGVHLTGRVISAVAGALTVAVVFLTCVLFTNLLGSLLAATALAVAPGHVVHSQFQTSDSLGTLLCAMAIYAVVRVLRLEDAKASIWLFVGLLAGLFAGARYSGLVLAPVVVLVALLRNRPLGWASWRFAGLTALGVALGFVIATPGVLLEWPAFVRDFTYESGHVREGHGIVFAGTSSGFLFHIGNMMEAFGAIAMLLGVVGLALWVSSRSLVAIAVCGFALLYYVLIGSAEVKFLRYTLPLLVPLALGLGYVVGEAHARGGVARLVPGVALLAIGYSMIAPGGALALLQFMRRPDPRDIVAAYLREKRAPTETVGFVTDPWFYTPPLFPDTGLLGASNRVRAMREYAPYLIVHGPTDGPRKEWDVRLLTEDRPEFLCISSFEFIDHDRINQPDFVEFLQALPGSYDVIAWAWAGRLHEVEPQQATRDALRAVFLGTARQRRFPLTHDMMYIQPTVCVLRRRN